MKGFGYVAVLSFLLMLPQGVFGEPQLVSEPALSAKISWDINPNGMLVVGYDTDHNGKADLFTLRIVIRSYFSILTEQQESGNFPNNILFCENYESDAFYYITEKQPLFYAIDVNEDGVWDIVHQDLNMDGLNGNETYYDSPSGMFARCHTCQ